MTPEQENSGFIVNSELDNKDEDLTLAEEAVILSKHADRQTVFEEDVVKVPLNS
jgi:hypothetical protein